MWFVSSETLDSKAEPPPGRIGVCGAIDPITGAICNRRGPPYPSVHRYRDADFEFTWTDTPTLILDPALVEDEWPDIDDDELAAALMSGEWPV